MKFLLPFIVLFPLLLSGQSSHAQGGEQQPYYQGLTNMYNRHFEDAVVNFQDAYRHYMAVNKPDSACLSLLHLTRMRTITRNIDTARATLEKAKHLASQLANLSPMIRALTPYVEGGIALMSFDIRSADSLIDVTLEAIDENLGECNLYKINALVDLGIVRHVQRRYNEADSIVNGALSCGLSLFDSTDMRLMATYNMLGALSDGQGYNRKSVKYYRAALKCMEENGQKDTYDYARLLNNLANALYEEGGALAAIEILEESLQISEKYKDYSNNISGVYYNIANMLFSIGYRNKAIEYLDKAESSVKDDAIWSIPYFYNLFQLRSRLHALLGNPRQSQRDFEKAVKIVNRYYGEGSVILADLQLIRSYTLKALDRDKESLEVLLKGIKDFHTYGWNPLENNLGEFYYLAANLSLNLGDTIRAVKYNLKAINEYQNAPPRLRIETAFPESELAAIYLAKNDVDSARHYISFALKSIIHDPKSFGLLKSLELHDYARYHSFRYILGTKIDILLSLYESTQDGRYLSTALSDTRVLEEHLEINTSTYLEEDDAVERIKLYWSLYEKIINVRITAYHETGNDQYLFDAVQTTEKTKDILYKMALRKASAVDALGLDEQSAQKEEEFQSQIENLESDIYNTRLDSNWASLDSLQNELVEINRQYDLFKKNISDSHPRYYSARYGKATLNLNEVQGLLNKRNVTLINFFAGDEEMIAFILDKDKIKLVKLGKPEEINPIIDSAIVCLRTQGDLSILETLYKKCFAPLKEYISSKDLIIIPDGKLHFIPFEALKEDDKGFLVQDYSILYSHSIGPLLSAPERSDLKNALGVAPGFEKDVKHQISEEFPFSPLLELIRQPNALTLVHDVNHIMPTKRLVGESATEANFKSSLAKSDLLLLATHAEVDEAFPLYSRIALLPEIENNEDGLLHVYEILGLDMEHDLAILTACETGLGSLDRGQGVTSLSHAFRYAGCQNIIMSLWSIDERQSTDMMKSYISDINRGEEMTGALTNAKREYLNTRRGELRHPYYWAGLVLVGKGNDPINWRPQQILLFLGGAFVFILVGGFFFYRRRING